MVEYPARIYHISCKLKTVPDKKKTKTIDTEASLTGEYDCLFAIEHGLFISVEGTGTMNMNTEFNSKDNPVQMNMVLSQTTSLKFKSAEYSQPPEDRFAGRCEQNGSLCSTWQA